MRSRSLLRWPCGISYWNDPEVIMFVVSVQAHYDSAHFLRNYKGKCERLHGPRYVVEAALATEKLDDTEGLSEGDVGGPAPGRRAPYNYNSRGPSWRPIAAARRQRPDTSPNGGRGRF